MASQKFNWIQHQACDTFLRYINTNLNYIARPTQLVVEEVSGYREEYRGQILRMVEELCVRHDPSLYIYICNSCAHKGNCDDQIYMEFIDCVRYIFNNNSFQK